MTALYTAEEILAVPVPPDGCSDGFPGGTIGDFFHGMLLRIWNDPDDFSGKRPYGNSGWPFDLYAALVRAEMISGSFDEWGYIEECDDEMGDRLITLALHGSRLVSDE